MFAAFGIHVMVVVGCHPIQGESPSQDILPALKAMAHPETALRVGAGPTIIEINQGTFRLQTHLVLRLDYYSEHRGIKSLRRFPKCVRPFKPHEEIGFITCEGQEDSRRVLLGKMVDQDCYTRPHGMRVIATEVIEYKNCRVAHALLHQFSPPLRLDTEIKD